MSIRGNDKFHTKQVMAPIYYLLHAIETNQRHNLVLVYVLMLLFCKCADELCKHTTSGINLCVIGDVERVCLYDFLFVQVKDYMYGFVFVLYSFLFLHIALMIPMLSLIIDCSISSLSFGCSCSKSCFCLTG